MRTSSVSVYALAPLNRGALERLALQEAPYRASPWGTSEEHDFWIELFTETRPVDANAADTFDLVMKWLDVHSLPASDLEVDAKCLQLAGSPNGPFPVVDSALVVLALLYPGIQKRLDYLATLTSEPDKRKPFHHVNDYEFQPDPDNERAVIEYGLNRLYDDAQRKARHDANPTPWHIMLRIMDEAANLKLTGGWNLHGSNLCPICDTFRSYNGACMCPSSEPEGRFTQINE